MDGFLYLKIKALDIGILEFPKLPDTSLFNTGEEESYEAEGKMSILNCRQLSSKMKW